jgi:putative ABC transport system permease protein
MFKLNLKIALRNIWKNKTSSLINISGLATGLAACLILLLYVAYEWNYDRQTIDPDQTYKVLINNVGSNGEIQNTGGATSNSIAPLLKQNYTGVIAAARLENQGKRLIAYGTQTLKRTACFADADILNIYDYTFIHGDRRHALREPNSVILTASTADLLFGTRDVLGKSVKYDNKTDLKVTAVIKDLPANTSDNYGVLLPWSLNEAYRPWIKPTDWGNRNYTTIVRMSPGTDIIKFNQAMRNVIKQHASWSSDQMFLFQLKKLHLYDTFVNGKNVGGKIDQLRLFMGLAIGILLIACINFMNMATARSEKRAKEVGIKKTIGATRSSLISQFLMESMVLTILSTILAIVLIELFIPLFNSQLDIKLDINYSNISIWTGLISVVFLTGLIAGSYPAFYLSSFSPVQVLTRRRLTKGVFSISLRQVLVVSQFSFAVLLIIATAVIYKQIQYLKNRPVGYEINQLVEMPQEGLLFEKIDLLRDRLVKSGAVLSLYQSSGTIAGETSSFSMLEWPGSSESDKLQSFSQIATTFDFVKTTGVKLLDGRDFSRNFASDSAAVLLNRSAVNRMNMKNPVGKTILAHGNKVRIVGVFEDFILGSPSLRGNPLIVIFMKGWGGKITMRMNPAKSVSENISTVQKIVKEINPAYPAELTFVDQLYAEKLQAQRILGILSNLFGGLAIFISCLGLFGLATYSAEQRTKEIGVRKVLGASVSSLMQLLSLSFLKMVGFAIVISVPVASYLMNNWLKGFDFHTNVSWIIVSVTAAGTLCLALLTVSFQAYKAANANPVDALKYE